MRLAGFQINRVETIIKQWHEAGRAEFERNYTRLDYDSPTYNKKYKIGSKYVSLETGSSGAFLVDIASGIVYEIKSYGVANKKKIVGEAWKETFHGAQLHDCRYIRGPYDNRPHLWIPTGRRERNERDT